MSLIMLLYYIITACIAVTAVWNFIKSDGDFDELAQYLVVCVPLVLRLLRIK